MKRTWLAAALAAVSLILSLNTVSAASYTFVGSWYVDEGPAWFTPPFGPPVYSGQGAAALLFGGSASDYAISTVDASAANINFSAWLDGWGDDFTYGTSGNPAPENYSLDMGGLGYNSSCTLGGQCGQSAYSAYISDHGLHLQNFAFHIDAASVPVPAALPLFASGLGVLGFFARRRKQKPAAA